MVPVRPLAVLPRPGPDGEAADERVASVQKASRLAEQLAELHARQQTAPA